MKKIVLSLLIVLSVFLLTGCNKVKVCKNCVYSRYVREKKIGEELTEYKENYKEIKNKVFLGHVIDKNNIIKKSYICGIDGNDVYCLESSKYKENKEKLNKIYGKKSCNEIETSSGKTYTCSDELVVVISEKGINYISESKSNLCYEDNGYTYCADGLK